MSSDAKVIDPFVSTDEAAIDDATTRLLEERVQTADQGKTVPAAAAREQMLRWLSKSATTKTR